MRSRLRRLALIGLLLFGTGLVTGAVAGAQWYRSFLFPLPQIRNWARPPEERVPLSRKMVTTRYTAMTPVFSDRQYFDSVGDGRLEGLFLLQIPRHYSEDIPIRANSPLIVYRFISEDNDNAIFDNWTPTDIPINVRGNTTTHTRVVKKEFPAGTFTLKPGGPIASSPVLIEIHDDSVTPAEFEVLEQAEFVYTK